MSRYCFNHLPASALRGGNPARAAILAAAVLSAPCLHAADVNWTNAATSAWSLPANWSSDPALPLAGDNLFFGLPGSATVPAAVATAGGTFSIDADISPVVGTLNLSDTLTANPQTNWTFSPDALTNTAPITFTLNSGINLTAFSNHAISPGTGVTTLSVVLGGNQTWNIARSQAATPGGSGFSGLTVSAPITDGANSFNILKTGPRQLTLSGNNTFDGGITHREGVIVMGGAAANTVLGSGTFTFSNLLGGPGNTLALNAGVSKTFTNNFVQNNAASVTGTQYAQLSFFGFGNGYRVLTFDGSFSTGPDYNTSQSLFLGANSATSSGLGEGALIFNGDFSAYAGVGSQAFRVSEGSVVINSAAGVPASGGYTVIGNNNTVSSKLVLSGAYTLESDNPLSLTGGTIGGLRNSFGSRNAAATTATMNGTVTISDVDGANLFSQTAGATLAVAGNVSGAGSVQINQPYTYTTANTVNSLQVPAGTVALTKTDGNSNSGGFTVAAGTLLVNNLTNSATGVGQVTIGASGPIIGAPQAGLNAATSRVITGVNNGTAKTLVIGQAITGTNIPANSIITGIGVGAGLDSANASTVVIDKTMTVATITSVDFTTTTTGATTAVLAGTGRISPRGANGLLVNSGSSVNLVDGATGDLEVNFREIPEVITPPTPAVPASGTATFASGATFAMELGAPTVSDSIAFTGLGGASTASVVFNANVINFTALPGLAPGTYTLFTFDDPGSYTGEPTIGTGLEAYPGSDIVSNPTNIQLVIPGAGGDYASWATANGIGGEPKDDDSDSDGYDNVIEYALGYNPTASNPGVPLVPVGPNFEITFPKGAEAAADASVHYFFQTSTNLSVWSANLAPTFEDATMVKFTLPGGASPSFVRLVIVDP